jgi:hypothetical protein
MENIEVRINAAIEAAESAKTLGELKGALRELKSLGIETADTNEAGFRRVQAAVGQVNDKVNDLNQAYKSMSGTPVENITNSFKGLKDAMLSLDFGQMKLMFANLASSAVAGITSMGRAIMGLIPITNLQTTAMYNLAGAIAATGIGLLVIAVALLISNFDTLKDSGGLLGKMFTAIGDTVQFVIQKIKDLSDFLGLTDFEGTERAKRAEKNAEKEKKAAEKAAEAQKKAAEKKKKQEEDDERDRKKRAEDKKRQEEEDARKKAEQEKKELDAFKKNKEDQQNLEREVYENRKKEQSLINGFKITQDELDRMFEEKRAQYTWMTNDEIYSALKEELQARKDATDQKAKNDAKEKEDSEKAMKEASDLADQLLKEEEDKDKERRKKFLENLDIMRQALSSFNLDIAGVEGQIFDSFQRIGNSILDAVEVFTDKSATLTEKISAGLQVASSVAGEINNIVQAKSQERLDVLEKEKEKELAALEARRKQGLITEEQLESGKATILDKYRKRERAEKKKAFAIDKAIQIVQATIQTTQAVLSGFAAGMKMGGIIPAAIFAAVAGAFGAAQIGLIAAQKFPEDGGAGGGGGAPSIPSPSGGAGGGGEGPAQPMFQGPTFFGLGQNNLLAGGGPMAQQVFVVESDISATQGRVAKIRERSIL